MSAPDISITPIRAAGALSPAASAAVPAADARLSAVVMTPSGTGGASPGNIPADRVLTGVLLMVSFCILAPLIDVASKIAVQFVAVGVVTLARFIVQGALMAPFMMRLDQPWRMSRRARRLLILRALLNIGSTMSFVAAVGVMPLADALAISFVEPFIILLIGRLWLNEQVGPRRISASVVGFGGALLVIQPSFAQFGAVALLPLSCALCFALYMLVTRSLSQELHPVAIHCQTALIAVPVCVLLLIAGTAAGIAPLAFTLPEGVVWLWCLAMGVAATVSHMAITWALKFAPSSTLAPLHYLEIVTATIFGYLFFSDFPGGMTWAGIAIIIGSGLYIIHRERVVSRRRALEAAAR